MIFLAYKYFHLVRTALPTPRAMWSKASLLSFPIFWVSLVEAEDFRLIPPSFRAWRTMREISSGMNRASWIPGTAPIAANHLEQMQSRPLSADNHLTPPIPQRKLESKAEISSGAEDNLEMPQDVWDEFWDGKLSGRHLGETDPPKAHKRFHDTLHSLTTRQSSGISTPTPG